MIENQQTIPLDQILPPPVVMRPVDRRCVEYAEMLDSMKKYGFLNSIIVRPNPTPKEYAWDKDTYQLADGGWRVSCAREACKQTAPCIVREMSNEDLLAIQLIANAQRPRTLPSEFARQIRLVLQSNEGLTQAQVCQLLNKRPAWVRQMLGMARIAEVDGDYKDLIDRGEIPLESAYNLSRIARDRWHLFIAEARTLTVREFSRVAQQELRTCRSELETGKLVDRYNSGDSRTYLRKLTEVHVELQQKRVGPELLDRENCRTPHEGWECALRWMLHLDPESLKRQQAQARRRLRTKTVQREIEDTTGVSPVE
jgi:ParB/RepB/Spo0J family partition protein